MRHPERWGAALALLAPLALVGCAPEPTVCPDIGWFNKLIVEVPEGVADVTVCEPADCDDPDAALQPYPSPDPDAENQWLFTTGMTSPAELRIEVRDAHGTVIARKDVSAAWERIGGAEQCGGPGEAKVTITAP